MKRKDNPKLVISNPAFPKDVKIPLVLAHGAVNIGGQSYIGWIPDYSAIKACGMLQVLFLECADDYWHIELFPECVHSALYEGGEDHGTYTVENWDEASQTEKPVFSLEWRVEGNLDCPAWRMARRYVEGEKV
jgi:hypothetical protein